MEMSSHILLGISLIFILILVSNSDNYMKDSICEPNKNYIDSIIQFENKRYFVIDNKFFEYDNNHNFRRRGDLYFEIQDYDKMDSKIFESDNQYKLDNIIKFGKFLSGFFIPKIDCKKRPDLQQNCSTVLDKTLSSLMAFVIYDQFSNKYIIRSKKFNRNKNIFEGIPDCLPKTNVPNSEHADFNIHSEHKNAIINGNSGDYDLENEDNPEDDLNKDQSNSTFNGKNEGNDGNKTIGGDEDDEDDRDDGGDGGDGDDEGSDGEKNQKNKDFNDFRCGPHNMSGKIRPKDWLINGILNSDQFKFLPVFFDEKRLEILIVFNKEYRFFGDTENPSPIRTDAKVWWKRITYEDSKYGWESKTISNENTYTAFLKEGDDVYLIAEPFKERHKERGPSMMLKFDLSTKELIEKSTNKNPLELFGCSFGSDNWIGYIVIAILLFILLVVIIGWIFACYWLYARDAKTTYNQSVEIENT